MKNLLIALVFISIIGLIPLDSGPLEAKNSTRNPTIEKKISKYQILFKRINLNGVLAYNVFETAMKGFDNQKHSLTNSDIITIIDFSLPSSEKRMYVIDLKNKKLLFHTIVSHGKNSGDIYATKFSNNYGSFQSSLGYYVTENTYEGRNGYSLVINGLEKNINDQAKARAVVIHGADYCSEAIIKKTGRLGRSQGCPALPRELNTPIINTIKEGSMVFIYADNREYFASSKLLQNRETRILAQTEETSTDEGSKIGRMR